jgi:iron complex transport system permease protein
MLKHLSERQIYAALMVLLVIVLMLSASVGAYSYTPAEIGRYAAQSLGILPMTGADALDRNVFLSLRLPRVLLSAITGAVLGVSGSLMQGLFRNPIVEPGLAGTSAGAALGAALVFVLGGASLSITAPMGALAVPVFAFAGGFVATMIVYRISAVFGKVNVFTLLLAGIAINAMCAAGTGFLSYIARDPQARNITFWNLGTFTSASWPAVAISGFCLAFGFLAVRQHAKSLDALTLGEDEAALLGVNPRRLILTLLVINTIMVAAVTAAVGVIAFVGLVIPHILRMLKSPRYAFLLPASALLGAIMLTAVDVIARLLIPPAELPIGIITAVIGAPVFLAILLRDQRQGLSGIYG